MRTAPLLALANFGAVALAAVEIYGQCGGSAYTGDTECVSGACCTAYNEWYSQCVACGDSGSEIPTVEEQGSETVVAEAKTTTTKTKSTKTKTTKTKTTKVKTTKSASPTTAGNDNAGTTLVVVPTSGSGSGDDEPAQTTGSGSGSGSGSSDTPTTTSGSGSGGAPSAVTRSLPASSGAVSSSTAISVSGSFDGGMKLYDRSPSVCKDQSETGEKDAMFILEDSATLSNVIIGPGQAEGVHCKGTCTLINVWWQDVCEDAITLKQSSGTSKIVGGGAFHASDKIVQFNGRGTVEISNFYAEDYGKLVRACGNCKDNGGPRNIVIDGVVAIDGGVLCGINTNYGDTCTISNSCQDSGKTCDLFTGNSDGSEPEKISSGPDGKYCKADSFKEAC